MWPHLLSLDAPLVAVAWQGWWAHATGVALPPCHGIVLLLGVWLMYLGDRLADLRRARPDDPLTARHGFAGRQRRFLLVFAAVLAGILTVLAPCALPPRHFAAGLGLLALVGGYFWLIHRRQTQRWCAYFPKEAMVGGMFAFGTAFFVLWRLPLPSAPLVAAVSLFALVCFLNCALITRWEQNVQDLRHPASLLNSFPRLTRRGLQPLCWVLGAMAAGLGVSLHTALFLPLAASALSLGVLDRCRQRLSVNMLRVLADAVLLTPWIYFGVACAIH